MLNLGLWWTWGLRNFLVAATLVIQEPQLLRSQLDLQGAEEGRSRDRGCLNVLFGATSHTGTSRNMFFLNISSSTTNINVDMWHIHYCHASYTILYLLEKSMENCPPKPYLSCFNNCRFRYALGDSRHRSSSGCTWKSSPLLPPIFDDSLYSRVVCHASCYSFCLLPSYYHVHYIFADFFLPIKNIFGPRWPLPPSWGGTCLSELPFPRPNHPQCFINSSKLDQLCEKWKHEEVRKIDARKWKVPGFYQLFRMKSLSFPFWK